MQTDMARLGMVGCARQRVLAIEGKPMPVKVDAIGYSEC